MPFDLVAWSEAAPGAGTVGITAPVTDQIYTKSGDGILVKARAPYLIGLLYAAESTPGYVRLDSPSLQEGGRRYQFARAADLNDADPIGGWTDLLQRPHPLVPGEYLEPKSNNATDEDTIIAALLSDGHWSFSQLEGIYPTHRVRGSADQTLTANAWTALGTIVWDQTLAAGRYAIVGMLAASYIASGFMLGAARLILNESNWRPGVPIIQAAGDKLTVDAIADHSFNRWPQMAGIELEHDSMPGVEIISPAALTDHVVELDLVKIG